MNVAILIPAYNEEQTIGVVAKECRALGLFVVVVDDGSTDCTAANARIAGASVLTNNQNVGYGASLRRGLMHLLSNGYEVVVTLDGDGVHKPEHVLELIEAHFRASADLTIGSRFNNRTYSLDIPSAKIAANQFASALLNPLLGCRLTDLTSGMRVLGKEAMVDLPRAKNFSFTYELIERNVKGNRIIHEHPISVCYDAEHLFSTNRSEILDFTSFVLSRADENSPSRHQLMQFHGKIAAMEPVRIQVGDLHFVLHPVAEKNSYIAQCQSSFLSREPRLQISPERFAKSAPTQYPQCE